MDETPEFTDVAALASLTLTLTLFDLLHAKGLLPEREAFMAHAALVAGQMQSGTAYDRAVSKEALDLLRDLAFARLPLSGTA